MMTPAAALVISDGQHEALGFLHGLGRAAALLRAVRDAASADFMHSIIQSMRWRAIDGVALLGAGGFAVMTLALHR